LQKSTCQPRPIRRICSLILPILAFGFWELFVHASRCDSGGLQNNPPIRRICSLKVKRNFGALASFDRLVRLGSTPYGASTGRLSTR